MSAISGKSILAAVCEAPSPTVLRIAYTRLHGRVWRLSPSAALTIKGGEAAVTSVLSCFHPVHFATVLTAAVGIGLFLPPIGVGLLMALRFADVSVGRHFRTYWPYLVSLFLGLLILILFPELTLFLPRRAGLVR